MWEAVTNSDLQGVRERSRRPAERELSDLESSEKRAAESWQKKGAIHCRLEKVWRKKTLTTGKEEDDGLGDHRSHHQLHLKDCTLDRNILSEDWDVG